MMSCYNYIVKRAFSVIHHATNTISRNKPKSISSTICRYLSGTEYAVDITKEDRVIRSMEELTSLLLEHVGGKKDWLSCRREERLDNVKIVESQDDLEPRCSADSVQEMILPFKSEAGFFEDYSNSYGGVRVGKVLQDLDYLSVWCGFKYYKDTSEPRPPFSLVTVRVDKIDFNAILNPRQDLKLRGCVSWVGRTSLETTISIQQQEENGEWTKKAEAIFLMAARSLSTGRSAILNKMVPQGEEEERYYQRGQQNKLARRKNVSKSFLSQAPTAEERELIHSKFLLTLNQERAIFQSRIKPENTVWMKDSRLKNLVRCQPDKRNIFNKIFGGYLMMEAYHLAWTTACIFMKCNPHMQSISDIVFHKPVEIGSLLYLSSIVVYTSERHAQVRVVAEVYNMERERFEATDTFYFLFSASQSIPQIMPESYGEYILYLDGRRHCTEALRID